jgi:hypothetical protein
LNKDPFDRMIFDATNRLRTDPQSFVPYLQEYINLFDTENSKRIIFPNGDDEPFVLHTWEGVDAPIEALNVLKATESRAELKWGDGLALAASDHCLDMGIGGYVSHIGTDDSDATERAERYGGVTGIKENLIFGLPNFSAEMIVMYLFIDDGVADRTH